MNLDFTKRILPMLLLVLGIAGACGDPPPPAAPPLHQFTVEVRVEDSNADPLPRVPVLLDGKVVGLTDADGRFSGTLSEQAGKEVTLSVGELEGYKFPGGQTTEIKETLRVTKVNNQDSGVPVFLRVQAESLRKSYLVWVHARCNDSIPDGCGDLPITFNGEEVARTNKLGYGHFSFSEVPQSDVVIAIDTPSHNPSEKDSVLFEPRDPSYKLALDLSSHVYVVEQDFADPQAKTKKKRPTQRRSKKRNRKNTKKKKSSQKKSNQKKAEPKKPKGDGTINLWD